ncbi:carbohydrate kinase [Frankia sp. Cpl3]|uniref:carbohydrate kinase family protein n=1 Tax=Parafrankia colletiae TaxID=573497 RepID=UPI0009FD2D4D|nr:carbohydrate kinase [Parafrankia colletiae]MCK9903015.1 carbohydrate kinase [Frankia sp. Cpl3]
MTGYVAVVGENVADAIVQPSETPNGSMQWQILPGGSPANTAVALGRLGTPTRFLSRLPCGILGGLFTRRLSDSSVDLSLSTWSDEPATLAITSLANSVAHYEFYATGTVDWQWRPGELSPARLQGASCIHAGSLGLIMEPGGRIVEELLDSIREHATISIDPNVRTTLVSSEHYQSRLKEWYRLADIFRISEDDLTHLAPGLTPERIIGELNETGIQLAVVTRGEAGVLASFRGTLIDVPAVPTEIVDTIGAGDAFSAGLLHWLHQNGHLGGRLERLDLQGARSALMFASHVAALTCAAPGADPPWNRDLTPAIRNLLR